MQNGNKQRANKSKNRTTATTETKAARRARTTRATTMRETRMTGRKVPYHCGVKNQNCGFCVSKLECTTGAASY